MATHVVQQVQQYLEEHGDDVNGLAVEAAAARLKRTLIYQFSTNRSLRDPAELKLYPSEAGKCIRQIAYKAAGIPGEPMSADVTFRLAMGDMVELVLVYLITVAPGLTLVDNNMVREIRIGPRKWRGATDGILVQGAERRNLEVKSTSGIGFKMTMSRGVDDTFGYLTQASVYMRQLLEDGVINVPETVFVYVDRDSLKLYEVVVRYEEALAKAADEKFEDVIRHLEAKKLPQRPYTLNADGSLGLNCSYCSHKHTCWTSPRQVVTFHGMRPVYRETPTERLDLRMAGKKPVWVLCQMP